MTPLEFGEYIFKIRREGGLSRPAFSEKWGYHPNTIKSYEKDGRIPPIDYIAALSIETGASFVPLVSLLLSVGPLSKTEYAHTLDTLMDGQPTLLIGERNASYASDGKGLLQYRVDSDSMAPTVTKGAVVTYEACNDSHKIKDGSIILLNIEKNLILRRVQFTLDNQCTLSCDNPHYMATTYDRDAFSKLTVIGVIKYTLNPV